MDGNGIILEAAIQRLDEIRQRQVRRGFDVEAHVPDFNRIQCIIRPFKEDNFISD